MIQWNLSAFVLKAKAKKELLSQAVFTQGSYHTQC